MAAGLAAIRGRIDAAAVRAGRDPAEITLVAVSKTADRAGIRAAYDAGQRDFGENRAAALAERSTWLPDDARWHFIGRLQGNKVRLVRPVAHLLHSLDRIDLTRYWLKGRGLPPPVLVQVNIGREPQKAGALEEDAAALVGGAIDLGLDVRGLMAMAPMSDDPEASRPYFQDLAALRTELRERWPQLRELSMGMTDDFEVAIEEGATILRIGRAIFDQIPEDEREQPSR